MPSRQSPAQRETVERVMHEFKHGELKTAGGKRKVKNPKQAIAIALHEAGASKNESAAENKRNLRHTKAKERRGETARDAAEGKKTKSAAKNSTKAKAASSKSSTRKTAAKTASSKSATRKSAATKSKTTARKSAPAKSAAKKSQARGNGAHEKTKAELYAEAKRRDIPGRSKMDKAELERALRHH